MSAAIASSGSRHIELPTLCEAALKAFLDIVSLRNAGTVCSLHNGDRANGRSAVERMLSKASVLIAGLTALLSGFSVSSAMAAPVTREFVFSSTEGPLTFGPTVGSFTYDNSIVPSGGGMVQAVGLFSDLDVAFGTFSFNEATANTGWLGFNAAGELTEAGFGNNCGAGWCIVTGGLNEWFVRIDTQIAVLNNFQYSGFGGAQEVYITYKTPDPGTLALLGLGLAGLATLRRRAQ